jgi:ABC-2 type transport system permease protein
MPAVLQWISYVVPARHFIVMTRDAFVRGAGLGAIATEPLALVLHLAIAWLRLRRMQLRG